MGYSEWLELGKCYTTNDPISIKHVPIDDYAKGFIDALEIQKKPKLFVQHLMYPLGTSRYNKGVSDGLKTLGSSRIL